MKKEYIIGGVALLLLYLATRKPRAQNENVSAQRLSEILGGAQPTISAVEARNICRQTWDALEAFNGIWIALGDNNLYLQMQKLDSLPLADLALVAIEWKGLFGREAGMENLADALSAEYIPYFIGLSETSNLRAQLVQKIRSLNI